MNPERWQRLKELHARALELPSGERHSYLEQACGADTELLGEALELLATGELADFLEPPGAAPSAEAEKPRVLGDFELHEKLGEGGMGVVYRARQLSLQRDVALKLLPRGSAFEERHVERFRREAVAAAKLQHPAIVPIHFVGFEAGLHFFAMELIRGHSLNEELERLRAPATRGQPAFLPDFAAPSYHTRVAQLCASVADALHHAHQHGVVHRDVKPHNILLDGPGDPHVVDFGLAKVEELGSISRPGDIAGTPHYMSPEQALAKRVHIDHRTDVFSLGVVLYELLTLQRPFQGKTSHEVLYALSFREPRALRRLNPRVPRDLETICEKALAKQPEGRFASAGEFADDLRRFLGHEAIHAQRASTWTRVVRHVRRHRGWYVPSGAAALLLIGMLFAAFAWIERRTVAAQLGPLRELVEGEDWSTRPIEDLVALLAQARRLRASGVSEAVEERWLAPAVERIETVGRERAARGQAELERGLPSPAGTPIEQYRPASDFHYFRGLELLREASLLLPDDAELAGRADLRRTFPRLDVQAGAELAGAEVFLQTIDWLTQELGAPELLGSLPLAEPRPIEPGQYRITIVRPGTSETALCEFTRLIQERGRVYALQPRLRERAQVLAGMCLVPAGEYPLGNPRSRRVFRPRRAALAAYWIDAVEVTNAEYRAFVEASARATPVSWSAGYRPEWDAKPIVGVSFLDAQAYAEWRGKRLPTWFEWEAAARGPQGFAYPWGDASDDGLEPGATPASERVERAHDYEPWDARFARLHVARASPRDHSPFGLWDVLGNAWEWTETIHPGTTQEGEPYADAGARIVKGFHRDAPEQHPLYENTACPVIGEDRAGFRCATSAWSR